MYTPQSLGSTSFSLIRTNNIGSVNTGVTPIPTLTASVNIVSGVATFTVIPSQNTTCEVSLDIQARGTATPSFP